MYDAIIIGGGPAGITAGLYIKRANFKVLVISKQEGALIKAQKIENYYGFSNGIDGKTLLENGINQAKNLGIEVIEKEVVGIKYSENNTFEVIVANEGKNEKYIAKTVVIATGANRKVLPIKGLKEFEGRGISYCAVCDAFAYRGKDVAVLGNGEYAISEIEELLPVAKSVTMLTDGNAPTEYRNEEIQINAKEIKEFRGTSKLEEVEFKDNSVQKVNGVFVALGVAGSIELAKKIGAQIQGNSIVVDENMETTVPNIYACGDCTGGILQVSKAVYEGTKTGLAIINKLRK